jgi:hypothetical protein
MKSHGIPNRVDAEHGGSSEAPRSPTGYRGTFASTTVDGVVLYDLKSPAN